MQSGNSLTPSVSSAVGTYARRAPRTDGRAEGLTVCKARDIHPGRLNNTAGCRPGEGSEPLSRSLHA